MNETFRYFSTFSGIGGFEIGIHNAYRKAQRIQQKDSSENDETGKRLVATSRQGLATTNGWPSERTTNIVDEGPLCVGYSEIDKYAIKVYERHFNAANTSGEQEPVRQRTVGKYIQQSGDISNSDVWRRQPQSQKGHRIFDGIHTDNERIKNYGDITKIKANELPDFDCLVGGFPCQSFSIAGKRGGFGDTRGTLFFDLARIAGEKQPRLLVFENVKGLLSHDKGNTFRTIIATLDELGYDCQWQVLNSKDFGVPQNRERVIIIGHLRGTPRPEVFPIRGSNKKNNKTHKKSDVTRTITTAHAHGSSSNMSYIKVAGAIPESVWPGRHESIRRLHGVDGIAPTIPTAQGGGVMTKIVSNAKIRRLTPLECERLQAFPDNWTKYGADGELISDTQRYKMCGNAVTTNVIQAVFEKIFESDDKRS